MLSQEDIDRKIKTCFRVAVFNGNDCPPLDDLAIGITPGWDSLGFLRLVEALESEFNLPEYSLNPNSLTSGASIKITLERTLKP